MILIYNTHSLSAIPSTVPLQMWHTMSHRGAAHKKKYLQMKKRKKRRAEREKIDVMEICLDSVYFFFYVYY